MSHWRAGCTSGYAQSRDFAKPARLGVKEAHEELVESLHVQLLLEGQLVLEECSLHDAAAQQAQGACFNGLVNPSGCPLCTQHGMQGSH